MNTPNSKTNQAIAAFVGGDYKQALKIASTFRMGVTKQQSNCLKKGYECFVWPDQYRQLKQDPQACIEAAKAVFEELFMHEQVTA